MKRIDLVNRALPRAFFGYDRLRVDRLMQDLSDALARVTDEKIALAAKARDLETRLAEMTERETALRQALVAGQRVGEDIRASAHKEAQLILDAARLKADGILQDADARLARILEQAADAQKAKARFEMSLKAVIRDHLQLLQANGKDSASPDAGMRGSLPDAPRTNGPDGENPGVNGT